MSSFVYQHTNTENGKKISIYRRDQLCEMLLNVLLSTWPFLTNGIDFSTY